MTLRKGPRPDPAALTHGTVYTYRYLGCRCAACREANRLVGSAGAARRKAAGLPPGDPRHGSVTGYKNWGCRCAACTTTAAVLRTAEYRQRETRRTRNV